MVGEGKEIDLSGMIDMTGKGIDFATPSCFSFEMHDQKAAEPTTTDKFAPQPKAAEPATTDKFAQTRRLFDVMRLSHRNRYGGGLDSATRCSLDVRRVIRALQPKAAEPAAPDGAGCSDTTAFRDE